MRSLAFGNIFFKIGTYPTTTAAQGTTTAGPDYTYTGVGSGTPDGYSYYF